MEEKMQKQKFCPLSLRDWLRICRQCRVPHVPAKHVVSFETNDVKYFDTKGPHQTRLQKALRVIEEYQLEGHMMRWDHCSEASVKSGMAEKEFEWHKLYGKITLGDVRAFDLLFDYPYFENPIWRRPWVPIEIIDGFPVEYRVFVENGELKGISNYYLQRPLPENGEHIAQITYYVAVLIHFLREHEFKLPVKQEMESYQKAMQQFALRKPGAKDAKKEADHVSFTADFLVLEKGYDPPFFVSDDADEVERRVLFLEGGPPFSSGLADPCCFDPSEGISGIAWEDRSGRKPLIEERRKEMEKMKEQKQQ